MRTTQRTGYVRPSSEADVYTPSRTPRRACSTPIARPPLDTFVLVALAFVLLPICILLARTFISTAEARSADLRDQLALELAVVAAHEGALDNLRDTALIYQVLEARAVSTAGRIALLRLHSGRALGRKPCEGGNCAWSVELLRNPHATPPSVDAAYWTRVRAGDWTLVMRKAQGLVYGIDDDRPCLGAPYSWGYAGDLKSAWLDRRLLPMGCAGTLNDGFALAPRSLRVLSADVAKGSSTP
jgi:hypothetical protein